MEPVAKCLEQKLAKPVAFLQAAVVRLPSVGNFRREAELARVFRFGFFGWVGRGWSVGREVVEGGKEGSRPEAVSAGYEEFERQRGGREGEIGV